MSIIAVYNAGSHLVQAQISGDYFHYAQLSNLHYNKQCMYHYRRCARTNNESFGNDVNPIIAEQLSYGVNSMRAWFNLTCQ